MTRVKRFVIRFSIALLTFILGLVAVAGLDYLKGYPVSNEISLRLADVTVLRLDESPTVKLYITNNGRETVTLVHPGDGSEVGWRPPVVWWTIREAYSFTEHSSLDEFKRSGRCGNMEALGWGEVFWLAPGETKEIEAGLPRFRKPGTYEVTFSYENQPWLEWKGFEMGIHNPLAMWRVKHSTQTSASSNEALIVVKD